MSWPVAVLAAVAQLKRERRVTDVGHRELKRALIRGDLQASSLLGGADGGGGDDDDDDDENENENVVKISARKGKKVLDITHEMSRILDCGVDRETVAVCISLLENGADPESLAVVVKELKREAKRLRESRERATTTTRMMMENSRDGRRV